MTEEDATERIIERLDRIVDLMLPGPRVDEADKDLFLTPARTEVYNLCDLRNTAPQIAERLGKSEKNISKMLSELRSKGLIRTVRLGGRTVYMRLA